MRLVLPSFAAGLLAATAATASPIPPDLRLVEVADGFSQTVAVRHAGDGSGRLFVVERSGAVRILDAAGTLQGTLMDLVANPPPHGFSSGGERGLLGLAFHPDYPADPRVFVHYSDNNASLLPTSSSASGDTVIASFEVVANAAVPASAEVLVRVNQDFSNHNGGDIHFGPDGYLYIALGDGGSGGDPCDRAQTLDPADLSAGGGCSADGDFTGNPDSRALLGKMLRIDVDATTAAGSNGLCGGNPDGSAGYAIPAGNPFADGATANGCDEVWHYGLRNPYRFSFDRDTGDQLIADVGQNEIEEIDFAAAGSGGHDFGWNRCEGTRDYPDTGQPCAAPGTVLPILEYDHSQGECSVTGGYRYRGPVPALDGIYFYGDFCSGRLFFGIERGGDWTQVRGDGVGFNITGFGEGEDGALFVLGFGDSAIYRIESDYLFLDDFETP